MQIDTGGCTREEGRVNTIRRGSCKRIDGGISHFFFFFFFFTMKSQRNREARNENHDPVIMYACKILIYITTGVRNMMK